MAELWRAGLLCDVVLHTGDGAMAPCHRVALASASGYFRALLTGAGACMAEGGCSTVQLRELSEDDMLAALCAVYDHEVKVRAGV